MTQVWSSVGVCLFRADLHAEPEAVSAFAALLSPDETERASRYGEPTLRRRFIVRRALLRSVLAANLGTAAQSIEFAYGEFGKPTVPGAGIDFSVSSSHDEAAILLSCRGCVGVDIQKIEPHFPFEGLFDAHMSRALEALPKHLRCAEFFRAWTRKEALGKALGVGVAEPLPHRLTEFDVRNLDVFGGFAAAVATKPPPLRRYVRLAWPAHP